MSGVIEGGCHCGAIRYRVAGELTGVINCHCSDCRRWHGNYAAYAVAKLSDFQLVKGDGHVKWYESSGKARRGFCPDCGSSLLKDNKDGEKIVLAVGAIDPPTGLSLLKNIMEDSKGDYYELPAK